MKAVEKRNSKVNEFTKTVRDTRKTIYLNFLRIRHLTNLTNREQIENLIFSLRIDVYDL